MNDFQNQKRKKEQVILLPQRILLFQPPFLLRTTLIPYSPCLNPVIHQLFEMNENIQRDRDIDRETDIWISSQRDREIEINRLKERQTGTLYPFQSSTLYYCLSRLVVIYKIQRSYTLRYRHPSYYGGGAPNLLLPPTSDHPCHTTTNFMISLTHRYRSSKKKFTFLAQGMVSFLLTNQLGERIVREGRVELSQAFPNSCQYKWKVRERIGKV